MKKITIAAFALAGALLLNSCTSLGGLGGMMNPGTTTQQTTQTGGGIGDMLGGLGSLSGLGDILSSALGITTQNIVGTWVYEQPAVVFESDNFLTKAGGQLAAQTIANKLDTYYRKVGITPGKFTMTFDKNGNFTQSVSGKTMSGTYAVENGNVKLTYAGGVQQLVGTTQFDGNYLVIVVDMTKLLNLAKTISASSQNSTISGIASLANGVSGMKAGLKFKKK